MKKFKICNLYSGIGGNRKLWDETLKQKFGDNYEITAIEYDENIAAVYRDYFPNDIVIVTDAHQYLLDHFKEFDFIWSSPPCPSHSRLNTFLNAKGIIRYPDMNLYQEIILLKQFFKGKYVIENVIPYYEPLIKPMVLIQRHYFWSNFNIEKIKIRQLYKAVNSGVNRQHLHIPTKDYKKGLEKYHGFDLSGYGLANELLALRNCVNPKVGKFILDKALNIITEETIPQGKLF